MALKNSYKKMYFKNPIILLPGLITTRDSVAVTLHQASVAYCQVFPFFKFFGDVEKFSLKLFSNKRSFFDKFQFKTNI